MCPCRAASSLPPAQPHTSGCFKRWIDSASGVRSEERAASAVARRRAEAQLAQQQCEFDAMVRAVSDDGSSRLQARERDHDTQRTVRRGAARLSTRPSRWRVRAAERARSHARHAQEHVQPLRCLIASRMSWNQCQLLPLAAAAAVLIGADCDGAVEAGRARA